MHLIFFCKRTRKKLVLHKEILNIRDTNDVFSCFLFSYIKEARFNYCHLQLLTCFSCSFGKYIFPFLSSFFSIHVDIVLEMKAGTIVYIFVNLIAHQRKNGKQKKFIYLFFLHIVVVQFSKRFI